MAYINTRIKSIQRGTITLSGANLTATATVTSVDTTKAILSFLGQHVADQGGGADANNLSNSAYLSLTNATTITATRYGRDNQGLVDCTTVVSYQLVEYY